MTARTFLVNAIAAGVIGLTIAWLQAARAGDRTTGPAARRRDGRRGDLTPLARRLAADTERIRNGTWRPARAIVIAAYLPAVNRARLAPTRRLARRERRLRRAYRRTGLRADQLVDLAAARMVLAERGRALPALDGKPLPRLVEGAAR
jgi:hypothetical protein